MDLEQVLKTLKSRANPRNVEGMARYGINPDMALGITVTELRKVAREIGKDHSLALELWGTGIHEARILAAIIDDPALVTRAQMELWVKGFNSWDLCDQACTCLFDMTPFAFEKAVEWSHRRGEFVKRAGFALMAGLAVHHESGSDADFLPFLEHIEREAVDERHYVKKGVNWALRNIGKRSKSLNRAAIRSAIKISKVDSRSARWIASDALRELRSEAVLRRLSSRGPARRPARRPSS
jgi:3-methyladenine DNA glycosylase AlkD